MSGGADSEVPANREGRQRAARAAEAKAAHARTRASGLEVCVSERPERANARLGVLAACVDGGEGGIRTRDGLPRTAFPVRRHSPLGDLSGKNEADRQSTGRLCADECRWRRGRDSNPRCFRTPLFESGTINHSDTSPRREDTKAMIRRALARSSLGDVPTETAAGGGSRERPSGRRRRRRTAPRPRRGGCR